MPASWLALRPTPGSVSGTKIVLLQGGPPEWGGEVTGILRASERPLERWDHTADLIVLYVRTDEVATVRLKHERRDGTVVQEHQAEVWVFAGYKEDWVAADNEAGSGGTLGRQLCIEGVREAEAPAE